MSETGQKTIELPASITVRDLAQLIKASPIQVIKILMSNGVMASINQTIDLFGIGINYFLPRCGTKTGIIDIR